MRVLICLVISLVVVSALPKIQERIQGGADATINTYPSIVSLLFSSGTTGHRQKCNGVIVSQRSALTAAHCTDQDLPTRWQLRVGSSSANSGGQILLTDSILIHTNYEWRTLQANIAIIRPTTNFILSDTVQQASLAAATYIAADGQPVNAVGWGATQFGGVSSELLQAVQVYIINQEVCRERYTDLSLKITDDMLCAGVLDAGGRSQCNGDDGGPLFHNNILVGISSFGEGCGLARYPHVNTRVSMFSEWIQANAI